MGKLRGTGSVHPIGFSPKALRKKEKRERSRARRKAIRKGKGWN